GAGGADGREPGQRVEAPGAAAPAPSRGPAQGGAQRVLPHLGPDDVRPVRSGVHEPGAGAGGEPGGVGGRLRWRPPAAGPLTPARASPDPATRSAGTSATRARARTARAMRG